ncbi:fibronectin type III-like domain-contianing protein [Maribacter sp. ANRC-HE7]|uniref:Fibronectin type III-like domain-contianing protein n=1 Tax=Maribacter aquimaris TaxID=2737171 RepID=A0ABR7V5Z8_9FLAO|nr:fibronectin type III-like domain-contianing protein [Maribacter aquimaris]
MVGFERIHLKVGEAKKVAFSISPKSYALISEDGEFLVEPGSLEISVGGKQPGFKGVADPATSGVITKIISLIN